MAAVHGKAATLYMGSLPLTDYFRAVQTAATVDTAESSTFGQDDKTYVAGLGDATLSGEGIYDTSGVGAERDLHEALGSATKQVFSVYHGGDSFGSPGVGMSADTTSMETTADLGDIVMISAEAQSSTGYENLVSLHAFSTVTASGTSSSYDGTAGTGAGAAGYLHVAELSGSVAFRIEHSSDEVTWGTLINFGTITGALGTRVAATGTVEQYLRLVHTATSGTAAYVCGLARKR